MNDLPNRPTGPETYAIGWDVGGWNCDRNPRSRDALVILDAGGQLLGRPWRGNLRRLINEAATTQAWLAGLFALCRAPVPAGDAAVALAIDTPLAFSGAFRALLNGRAAPDPIGQSDHNPYLYRRTERELFARGLRPMSPLKDMIGSQATKGLHVLAKFAPRIASCGVWTDGRSLTAFEAYPSAARSSPAVVALAGAYGTLGHQDMDDALLCALVAHLYVHHPALLWPPPADVPSAEGWIWVPFDALQP